MLNLMIANQHLQIPIRSSFSPISSALVHGYKIETIIKLFDLIKILSNQIMLLLDNLIITCITALI